MLSRSKIKGGEPAQRVRIAELERRVARLSAILRLVLSMLRISGFELEGARVPDAADKRRLLSAIDLARPQREDAAQRIPRPNAR